MTEWLIYAIIGIALCFYIFKILERDNVTQKSSSQPGTWSERDLVESLINYDIHPQSIFHNLYVNTYQNNYSQIDLVVATKVGLIVFEVKEYSGWIFGTGYQRHWTQVLNFGREKYRFYNPILQNHTHINQLKKKLPLENVPYFSIIVFYGDSELKDITHIPQNTYITKFHTAYEAFENILNDNPPANYKDKRTIIKVLSQAVENGKDPIIQQQHSQNISKILSRDRIFN